MIEDPKFLEMAKLLKAIAHPTRLFILDRLKEKSYCVCELTELIGDDVSTVSKHLKVLRDSGIISNIRKGNNIYLQLKLPCILDIYRCIHPDKF